MSSHLERRVADTGKGVRSIAAFAPSGARFTVTAGSYTSLGSAERRAPGAARPTAVRGGGRAAGYGPEERKEEAKPRSSRGLCPKCSR